MPDGKNIIIYKPNNNSANKAQIVKIENDGYAAIKPLKDKFIKLHKLLKSFSHLELREHILQNILKNKTGGIELKTWKTFNLRKEIGLIWIKILF